jgi:hypothetical protein
LRIRELRLHGLGGVRYGVKPLISWWIRSYSFITKMGPKGVDIKPFRAFGQVGLVADAQEVSAWKGAASIRPWSRPRIAIIEPAADTVYV